MAETPLMREARQAHAALRPARRPVEVIELSPWRAFLALPAGHRLALFGGGVLFAIAFFAWPWVLVLAWAVTQ